MGGNNDIMDTDKEIQNLVDPTADYCKKYAEILTKVVKMKIRFWYAMFRSFGCTAVDSIMMAREEVQDEVDKSDFTINFDGPMV